jgi:hypothetical protein
MQALTGFVHVTAVPDGYEVGFFQGACEGVCLVAIFPGAPPPVYWVSDDGWVPLSLTLPDPFGWVTTCH